MKKLNLTISTLQGCGGLKILDLIFSTLGGCGSLERTDFNSFHFGRMG